MLAFCLIMLDPTTVVTFWATVVCACARACLEAELQERFSRSRSIFRTPLSLTLSEVFPKKTHKPSCSAVPVSLSNPPASQPHPPHFYQGTTIRRTETWLLLQGPKSCTPKNYGNPMVCWYLMGIVLPIHILGIPSPFIPGILLFRKSSNQNPREKAPVFETNDGCLKNGQGINP